jgi:ABC-2 type transport system ATP-binding protein
MLRITGLTKKYRNVHALDRVSFEVRPDEVLGVIGPNGSGKTTLFECIGGVLPFDAGAIAYEPRSIASPVFYVPDGIAPWPSQTVRWALSYVSGLFGARAGALDAVIDALQLASLLNVRIGHLSKGQRKRALLALGLITPRPIVLADEPFDGLDLRQTRDVSQVLRDFARDGRTLVLSIHQVSDAARLCDRFVLLSNGTVRGEGTLASLMASASERQAQPVSGLEDAFLALT